VARYDDILEFEQDLGGRNLRVGIVMSRFNIDVCEGLLGACTDELRKHNVQPANVLLVTVAGSRSPSTANACTVFARDCTKVPSGTSPAPGSWPISSMNSRRAASAGASPAPNSPFGIDHAPASFFAQ